MRELVWVKSATGNLRPLLEEGNGSSLSFGGLRTPPRPQKPSFHFISVPSSVLKAVKLIRGAGTVVLTRLMMWIWFQTAAAEVHSSSSSLSAGTWVTFGGQVSDEVGLRVLVYTLQHCYVLF